MAASRDRLQLGELAVCVVTDGTFWLDGGTMFGIVPKALWCRFAPPDEENRIEIGVNCLLIRSAKTITLLEAGIGRDFSPRKKEIYRLDERTNLLVELEKQGIQPADVDRVVLTHLHFDHCGWCTREVNGRFVPTFPNARYIVQNASWEDAHHPNEFSRGGYLVERLDPLHEHSRLDLIEEETDLSDGIRLIPTPFHARGHQCVSVCAGGQTLFCPGDIIPTRRHLRLPYIMAYDRDPEGLIQAKSLLINKAVAGNWILFFIHDADMPLARLEARGDGSVAAVPVR